MGIATLELDCSVEFRWLKNLRVGRGSFWPPGSRPGHESPRPRCARLPSKIDCPRGDAQRVEPRPLWWRHLRSAPDTQEAPHTMSSPRLSLRAVSTSIVAPISIA